MFDCHKNFRSELEAMNFIQFLIVNRVKFIVFPYNGHVSISYEYEPGTA